MHIQSLLTNMSVKKFPNRSSFADVMTKNQRGCFLLKHGNRVHKKLNIFLPHAISSLETELNRTEQMFYCSTQGHGSYSAKTSTAKLEKNALNRGLQSSISCLIQVQILDCSVVGWFSFLQRNSNACPSVALLGICTVKQYRIIHCTTIQIYTWSVN